MKKKVLIIILVILGLALAAFAVYKLVTPKAYKPEILEPEVFEEQTYDTDLIIGLWQNGTVHYRFNDDGTGVTWDTADDVLESEGSKFTWEVNKSTFTHFHQMEIGGTIPKPYKIKKLDLMNLEYVDPYGVKTSFIKLE